MAMGELRDFRDQIADIASRLDLREPNREAVESIANEVSQFYEVEGSEPPFEGVVVSATGVGKTYILAGAMELFALAYEIRDFVIVTPGRTILEKTRDNLTPGHPKSLLGPMSFRPVVVTADNFATPAMRAAMDDDSQVKVYLFTVQSLIKPESKTGRKTHKFQEGLGTEFYAHLQGVERLVVFADEHHCYYGPAFSKAVRDLAPWVLVGLTATPDKKTPEDQIIFRYPLAAAIADKLVKTPVIVGRRDDRDDDLTKLSDGVTLLQTKAGPAEEYARANGFSVVNPVMLVVAKTIEDAEEYGAIVRAPNFFGGMFTESVLVVHSNAPDEALAQLDRVEDPESPVRIIISVGMLKEGWDVRNVYVIASMRSSVSEILTEQTLGRGMRLPFGSYTDIEILDTLEVVAHERYAELLKRAGVLEQAFIDFRSRAVLRINAQGKSVVVTETTRAAAGPILADGEWAEEPPSFGGRPSPVVTSVQDRTGQATEAAIRLRRTIQRRPDAPEIEIPILRMTAVRSDFSLADITDTARFRQLGAALAAKPDEELARTRLSAEIVVGSDGIKRTQLVTSEAADHVVAEGHLFPVDQLREELTVRILASTAVPARKDQRSAMRPLLDAFLDGLDGLAEEVLSANLDRAAARLIQLVETEQRRFMAKPSYDEIVELRRFDPVRMTDKRESKDRFGAFSRACAYEGWARSLFPLEWFDSSPELTVANAIDGDDSIACWVRLHINELPILWNSGGRQYNPDFIVVEKDGVHFVVEVKMTKEMGTEEVGGKLEAAKRWVNHVSADGVQWRYLLVSEDDVRTAKGSWGALKSLGT